MPFLTIPTGSLKLTRSYEWAASCSGYVPALAYLLGCIHVLTRGGQSFALPRIQDDAFYYLVIAKNIATTGRSDFTPGILTNGYQPLWMLAVLATSYAFGFAITVLKALDIVTTFAGFAMFAWLFPVRDLVASSFYLVALWYVLETMAINGMESSLLFPGMVLFVATFLSKHPLVIRYRSQLLFVSTAICIGARIDAALLLLPILAVAPVSRREKWFVLAGLAGCALVYGLANDAVFGSALPVSASVKSLGGMQLNRAYFAQFVRELDLARTIRLRSANSPYLVALIVLALALVLQRRQRVALSLPLKMIYCGAIGLAVFGLKLSLFSSWGVWPWYRFPELFFVLVGIWIIQTAVPPTRLLRVAQIAAGVCLGITQVQSVLADRPGGFAAASRHFIEERSDVLAGRTIAMGDRSGSFAFDYDGGVFQLEGLVNSVAYVEALKAGGDLRAQLCEMKVPLLVNYEVPLGSYQAHTIDILRPDLTSFRGPTLTVYKSEELTTFEDPSQYREENRRIYAWKLDCNRQP
jgi:hypothetical protein